MQDHPSSSMSSSHPPEAETWQAYWKEQGQPWRSEPLLDEEQQQRLLSYARVEVDIERGRYPFKGVRLSRADVEWLLAMEEQRSAKARTGGGTGEKQQKSFGLDVRGADLSGVNLSHLPMMRLHAGLSLEEGRHATVEQSRAAAANLAKADVSQAQLQGAHCVHWGDVNLTVVDWTDLKRLGDETIAGRLPIEEEEGAQPGERGLPASAERAIDILLRAQEVSDVVVSYVMRSPALTKRVRERLAREERAQPETQQRLELERYRAAVRANRQLAVVLRAQGLNEAADRFAYHAHVLQRRVLRRSGTRAYGSYVFSCILDVLAGYGYKPGRTLIAYLAAILSFAIIYGALGHLVGMSPLYALIISIISFHGRGFFPGGFLPTLPMAVCAACEAIIGLTIEISFIATFTQRYYGK